MQLPYREPLRDGKGYALAVGATAAATGLNFGIATYLHRENIVMIYLLAVALTAAMVSVRAAVLASVLCVAAFDFCFVPPQGTFAVADIEYVITFVVMLSVSLIVSTLTTSLREQSKARGEAAFHAQIEQMRADLLSAVSHDLRTPLASIEGSAGVLMRMPELGDESRMLAGTIQEESIRMSHLVRNLLDMTRVQGAIDLDLDWYGLDELAANAILRTEAMFEKPVQLVVAPDTPLVQVDGVLFEQVLVNLFENAARYAGRSAQVSVRIGGGPDSVRLTVADDGPGLPPGTEERIFQRFQGTHPGGFGLGLAICRAAVEAHGGKITAQNRVGGGAEFLIELPGDRERRHA